MVLHFTYSRLYVQLFISATGCLASVTRQFPITWSIKYLPFCINLSLVPLQIDQAIGCHLRVASFVALFTVTINYLESQNYVLRILIDALAGKEHEKITQGPIRAWPPRRERAFMSLWLMWISKQRSPASIFNASGTLLASYPSVAVLLINSELLVRHNPPRNKHSWCRLNLKNILKHS